MARSLILLTSTFNGHKIALSHNVSGLKVGASMLGKIACISYFS